MKTIRSIALVLSLSIGVSLVAAVAGSVFLASPVRAANLITLASFNGVSAGSHLIAGIDGNLYGTTYDGGANRVGTIFRVDPDNGVLTTLVSFDGSNGRQPSAGLISDGSLYGTTSNGGANNYGTLFKLDLATGALTTLTSFDGANGRYPNTGLIADADGNLYGTAGGGAYSFGIVFKLNPITRNLTTLASFDSANGRFPNGDLVADVDGNLYGTAYAGGASNNGTVFKLDPATGALTALTSFNRSNGYYPGGGLLADADGNLCGTTTYGGTNDYGTLFKIAPTTGALTTLASFNGANGSTPAAGLIADANGNLYGTTGYGGMDGLGTLFKFAPPTGTLATLASFHSGAIVSRPFGDLIADADGNLYGTTGGTRGSNNGTVFKLTNTGFVVPEPVSQLLLALGIAAIVRRRRA